MKKCILSLFILFVASNVFASSKANWTGYFLLKDGRRFVIHTPNYVAFDSRSNIDSTRPFNRSDNTNSHPYFNKSADNQWLDILNDRSSKCKIAHLEVESSRTELQHQLQCAELL